MERQFFVVATDSADLSPEAAAAISEISHDPRTGFRIKLHDKIASLDKLARHFNLYERETKGLDDGIAALIPGGSGHRPSSQPQGSGMTMRCSKSRQ